MKNNNQKYKGTTGVETPYVETSKVIDPKTNKPLRFIHQKAFHNIDVSTGWEVAPDGKENYSLDISLQEYDEDGNITIMFSPEAIIPVNKSDATCDRDNFPGITTVEMNVVRLYAKRVPTAENMPRITIVAREIGTNIGDTGARESTSDRDGGLELDQVVVDLRKDRFTLPLNSKNEVLRRTEITLVVAGKKADKYINVNFGNLESENFFRNMDGSSAKIDQNDKKIVFDPVDGVNKPGTLKITIPKGFILKDGMGYFVIPATINRRVYWLYANLYSEEHDELSKEKSSFFINFPRMSRNTSKDVYYINGQVFSRNAIITVQESRPSGYEGKPNGVLRIFNLADGKDAKSIFETSVVSGSATLNNLTQFNDYDELTVAFYQDNEVKASVRTKIVTKEGEVEIDTDQNYITPIITNSEYVVNSLKVNLYSRFSNGLRDIYYGHLVVTTDAGDTIFESDGPGYTFSVPQRSYNAKTLPFKYNVEVYQVRGMDRQLVQRRVIVIHKEGDLQIVPSIEVTPASLVIPVNKDHQILDGPHTFKVRVKQQGEYLDLRKWSITVENPDADLKLQTDDNGTFLVESFKGRRTFAEVIIKVARRGADIDDSYTLNYGITKNNIMDNLGDFVFVKYGTMKNVRGEKIYSFTTDPTGQLPPGEVVGPYYGITATHGHGGAPTDPNAYVWTRIETDTSISNEQEVQNDEFYIEGPDSIYMRGEIYDPEISRYTIKAINDYSPREISWRVRNIASGKWIEFAKEDVTHTIGNANERITVRFSNKLFDQNQKLSIKAVITANVDSVPKEFEVIFNTYAVRDSTLFAKIKTKGRENEGFHVFPRDKYNNTISGTKRSTDMVVIETVIMEGKERLEYSDIPAKGKYSVLDGPHFVNSSLDVEIVNNQYTLGFDYISGESGKISVLFGVGLEQKPVKAEYHWKTRLVGDPRPNRVNMEFNKDHFTINSATPAAMSNWSQIYQQYEENFINENEPIEIHFETTNTNINSLALKKDFNSSINLASTLRYSSGNIDFLPISILERVEERILATTVPNYEYLLVGENLANKKITYIRANGENKTVTIKNNHVFIINGNQKAIIITAPAGAEQIEIGFQEAGLAMYLLPISNALRIQANRSINYDDHILLTNTETVRTVIPRSFNLIGDYLDYRINPDNLKGYATINPKRAIDIDFFSNETPDITSNIVIETITGESQIRTIHRIVRSYEDLANFETSISTIAGKKYIVQQDISYLANSKEAIRAARESLISSIGEETITTGSTKPKEEYVEPLFEKVGDTYPLLLDKTASDPEDSDNSSIIGFHMKDKYFNVLKFKLRYDGEEDTSTLTNNFRIYNKTLADVYNDESSDEFSQRVPHRAWQEFCFLIPPAAESIEQIDLELEKYLVNNEIIDDIDKVRIAFQGRKLNKLESATYYLELDISHSDPFFNFLIKDGLEMKDIEVLQLNLAEEKENKIYKAVIASPIYAEFKDTTNSYMDFISNIEATFKSLKTGRLETENLDRNIYTFFKEANDSIEAVETEIAKKTHQNFNELTFQQYSDGLSYTVGIAKAAGMISSLQITPEGTMLKGEKNQIIGSTSIGNLYGKKIVIGKEITPDDIKYDKELIEKGHTDGTIAIWDKNKWASIMNKKGQYYLRYNDTKDASSLVGYMVMNPSEIAAYQFDLDVSTGFSDAKPIDVEDRDSVGISRPVFQIDKDGIVKASKLYVGNWSGMREGGVTPSVDLMNRIRIQAYESNDNKNKYRRGIVFLGINEGGN